MPFSALLAPAATRDLDALTPERREQVLAAIESYAADPSAPSQVKSLRGFKPPLLRLRVGDFRLLLRVVGAELHVYRVIDRKDLERALRRLR